MNWNGTTGCAASTAGTPPSITPTAAELYKTSRQWRDEIPRHQLRRMVRADTASDEQDFLDYRHASGVLVPARTGTTNPTQLAGYVVALPDDHNAAGDTIWYSGTSLASDLALPKPG